jgi:dihydrofolate reductase
MIVSAIVAKDRNNLIGIGLKMPWHLPKDFSYFKNITGGYPIIFGRLSFESIGCRPLPNRPHIIVSSDPELDYGNPNVVCVTTVEDAITVAESYGKEEVFICGGGQIYKYALDNNLVDMLYITDVNTKIKVDELDEDNCVYFPDYGNDSWDLISIENYKADEKNKYDMSFLVLERNF